MTDLSSSISGPKSTVQSPKPTHRILFFHNIPSLYRIPLFKELSKREGHEFLVLFLSRFYRFRKWKITHPMEFNHEFVPGITIELGHIILTINPTIMKRILKEDCHLVILNGISDITNISVILLCKMRGVKVLVYSEGTKDGQTRLGKLMGPWDAFWLKSANGMILPGTCSKQFYMGQGIREDKIFIAPDAVNNDYFISEYDRLVDRREDIRKELGLAGSITLLFIGQLIRRKGVDTLIKAFNLAKEERKDLHLLIVGDGPERDALEEYCQQFDIRDVHFTGWVDEDVKNQMYLASDIFVLPTRRDIWGLVINEAMCFRLPILASAKAGAASDLVIDGVNGYRVRPDDAAQLKDAMLLIVQDKLGLTAMGRESLRMVTQNNSIKAEADGFIAAIEATIGKKL